MERLWKRLTQQRPFLLQTDCSYHISTTRLTCPFVKKKKRPILLFHMWSRVLCYSSTLRVYKLVPHTDHIILSYLLSFPLFRCFSLIFPEVQMLVNFFYQNSSMFRECETRNTWERTHQIKLVLHPAPDPTSEDGCPTRMTLRTSVMETLGFPKRVSPKREGEWLGIAKRFQNQWVWKCWMNQN